MTNTTPIAVVTGGSRGLGKSMALNLAARGTDVILTYVNAREAADDVVREVRAQGRKAVALRLDVGRSETFADFAAAVKGELETTFGRTTFDYLVNNAGTGSYARFADATEELFDEQLRVHVKGPFFLTQKLLPLLADGGSILNMSSGLARYTLNGAITYGTMKGAVEVFTRYLALEVGPRGISVNVIAPGGVETDIGGGALRDDKELNQRIAAQTPMGRTALPDDIGRAVALLLAPEGRWITGQRFEATGGFGL